MLDQLGLYMRITRRIRAASWETGSSARYTEATSSHFMPAYLRPRRRANQDLFGGHRGRPGLDASLIIS